MLKLKNIMYALMLLQGCSSYQDQFDCPAGKGVGCKSVRQIDDMVEYGLIGQDNNKHPLHIWFVPYKDLQGNIHSTTTTVVDWEN